MCECDITVLMFFFFQAEDGIRDYKVTGVQTCALPISKLVAARLAADVWGVDTILIARTDANSATLLTSDSDEYDRRFVTGDRTAEGFFRVRDGVDAAIARALAYAPYADLLWFETSKPDLAEATRFAQAIHAKYPHKLLAYNCSPSFNWRKHLSDAQIAAFQRELGALDYKFRSEEHTSELQS